MPYFPYSEKWLEDFLFQNPYLISPDFENLKSQVEIVLESGECRKIDLYHGSENEITIIELKVSKILMKHVGQLAEYVRYYRRLYPNKKIKGILVGSYIKKSEFERLIKMGLKYMELGTDIPFIVKYCLNCRKAVKKILNKCNWCGSNQFFD